jgi:hypothetical protein
MNKAMVVAADWAEIAGMLSMGSANVFVTGRGKLMLSVHVGAKAGMSIAAWLKERGRKFSVGRSRRSNRIRLRFEGHEAVKVLTKTEGRLLCPDMKTRTLLAFEFWRTMQRSGVKLGPEAKAEREIVIRKFERIRTA